MACDSRWDEMGLAAAQREQKSAPQAAARTLRAPAPSVASPSPWGRIAVLQRTFGNHALQQVLPAVTKIGFPHRSYELGSKADSMSSSQARGRGTAQVSEQIAAEVAQLATATVHRLPDGGSPDAGAPTAQASGGGGTAPGSGHPAASATTSAGSPSPVAAPTLPVATFSRFMTTGGKLACCRAPVDCSPHLGVAKAGDPVALNGMNLFFKISGHRPTVEYGIVQAKHTKLCTRSGGTWTKVGETGPGAQDSPSPGATCLIPDAHGEIGMADAPGMAVAIGLPTRWPWTRVDEARSALNLTDWVIARERPAPWKAISHFFSWHSTTRILFGGTAELAPTGNAIGGGLMDMRGCPPF